MGRSGLSGCLGAYAAADPLRGGSADGLIFRVECARELVVVNLLGLDGLSSLVHRAVFF